MAITTLPQLAFSTNAREAMDYYHSLLGGELIVTRMGDIFPLATWPDLVAHSVLHTTHGIAYEACDDCMLGGKSGNLGESRTSITLVGRAEDEEYLMAFFAALSTEDEVICEYGAQPWGDNFGAVTDKYGNTWNINCTPTGETS
ncbi:VOC family protein [Bowdeniella massiliensis]|uniref:VOC family protein n=1 Tax=Bowdeniella massiliensis TaxID=2932264 RepID=UPI0020291DCD|nr:VOC family protein [Bowdeniella massiliensis]